MNTIAIITEVRNMGTFQGRDGKDRYTLEVEFKMPFSGKDGNLFFDNFVGNYFIDANEQAYNAIASCVSREVQMLCYFNIRPYKGKDGQVRRFQTCNIRNIYTRNYESQQ